MLWKNRVFSRRRLRTLAYIDLAVILGSILEGLGFQVGAMLGEVGPEMAIFGLFWALLGALH